MLREDETPRRFTGAEVADRIRRFASKVLRTCEIPPADDEAPDQPAGRNTAEPSSLPRMNEV